MEGVKNVELCKIDGINTVRDEIYWIWREIMCEELAWECEL